MLHGGAGPIIPDEDELAASLEEELGPADTELACVDDTDVLDEVDALVSSGRAPVLPPPPVLGVNEKSG